MISKHPFHFLSPSLNKWHISSFFEKLFPAFEKELNDAVKIFYGYTEPSPGEDDLFRVIERTWLGLFNNAMLRCFPGIGTLQEFMVWGEDHKAKGRCDLLFNWQSYDILVEAKCYEFKNDWHKCDSKKFYSEIIAKIKEVYYEHEKNYYSRPVLGMALVFEWIRTPKRLQAAIQIADKWPDKKDEETDFLALFSTASAGVIVYGKVLEL